MFHAITPWPLKDVQALMAPVLSKIRASSADATVFVLSSCTFIFIGTETPGQTVVRDDFRDQWLIALWEDALGLVDGIPPRDNWQDAVAHEIAHAWLNSQGQPFWCSDADDQIEEWGFNRTHPPEQP